MTKTYTIILTDAQDLALQIFAADPQDWITSTVINRCQIEINEVVNNEVQRRLISGEPISGTKDEIFMTVNIPTAAERQVLNSQTLVE